MVAFFLINFAFLPLLGLASDENAANVADFQMQVEYSGTVTPQATPENEEPENLKLHVSAQFVFSQQDSAKQLMVRKYRQATADIRLNEVTSKSELSEPNRQLTIRLNENKFVRPIQYVSSGGLLKQTELDLLMVPADPASFAGMFTKQKSKAGEAWKPNDQALRAFLAAENLIENDVQISIKEIANGSIKLYITGVAKAEVEGAVSRFQLIGLALVDETTNRVKGLRLTIDENRSASQLAPAFDGQVKIDVRQISAAEAERLASQHPNPINPTAPIRLLWSTDSEFELVYDPRWKIILSDQDAVVVRFADQGNLLAQCSILKLPKRPIERPLTLPEFRAEIEKLLTEQTAQLVASNTYTTNNGLTAHKIVVTGEQDDVPIDWIYYHVANPDGRRLAMIFTVEREVIASFGNADQKLLEAVRFVPVKTAENASGEARK